MKDGTARIFPQGVGVRWGQEVGRQAAQELNEHPELKQALAAFPDNP